MKVDGKLGSLVQGVSQQEPLERREGQHTEQVNMIADPVRGLSRRHGSIWQAEQLLDVSYASASFNAFDAEKYLSYEFSYDGVDYVALYRRRVRHASGTLPALMVYDKTNKRFMNMVRNTVDANLDLLDAGGVSAITAVGKYLFLAGTVSGLRPTAVNTNTWADATNQGRTVAWVRGGAYSRTYTVRVTKTDNTQVEFEYTTPTSSYPYPLDTSGVPVWQPDTTGAGAGTGPTKATVVDTITSSVAASSTYALSQTPADPEAVAVNVGDGSVDSLIILYNGLDFTISGTTLTWLRDVGASTSYPINIVYQYTTGGTSATVTFTTETTTEALYLKESGNYAKATLVYKDWKPTSLTVRKLQQTLTNVYPALPTTGNQFSWAGGANPVVFIKALAGNLQISAEYTHTKVIANPNYTAQVADLTNAHNSAVTKWIGTSSAATQPEAIAASLRTAAIAAGLTGVTRVGSTVVFTSVKDISTNDGGDGSLLKGVANEVRSVSDLTDAHYVGKVVKVTPGGGESFYMKATAKNPSIVSGVTEVVWVEGAGVDRTVDLKLIYGTPGGSNFYIASSASLLNAILAGNHPTYKAATVGDDNTSPQPHFIGRRINYLGFFQDRLLVGADSVVHCSRIADYLNFFRSTVLSLPADDPLQLTSQGQERDVIQFSALYDRDLLLFGRRQYAISGRTPLSPTNAVMPVVSSHAGADDAPPEVAGGLIFYAKRGNGFTSLEQIEPGRNDQSPESYPASSQLDDYMQGLPVELVAVSKPSTVFVRTRDNQTGLYVFSYLENSQGRLQDCWHRWQYSRSLGTMLGMSAVDEGLLLFWIRTATDSGGVDQQYLVADLQPLTGNLSSRPYLDSNRYWSAINATPGSRHAESLDSAAAYDDQASPYLFGVDALADVPDLIEELGNEGRIVVGTQFESQWSPTNPLWRDSDGKALPMGRLTVSFLTLQFRESSGFRSVVTAYEQDSEFTFNGRLIDSETNVVGRVPVTTGQQSIPIGRANREYAQSIYSLSWLPLRITSVHWTGQLFHRPRTVG